MDSLSVNRSEEQKKSFKLQDSYEKIRGKYLLSPLKSWLEYRKTLIYKIECPDGSFVETQWVCAKDTYIKLLQDDRIVFKQNKENQWSIYKKQYEKDRNGETKPPSLLTDFGQSATGKSDFQKLFNEPFFDFPKPVKLINFLLSVGSNKDSIILDFFAGSGTTGHAVMQLNAEDGGNRKFILCQIDEPIKKDKPAYQFCIDNNLPPVISSITIERLKRAGQKLSESGLAGLKDKQDLLSPAAATKQADLDVGFKVFDSVDAPKLSLDESGQILFPELNDDALSRIYNMIFTVGLDEPTQTPEELIKDCIYKIGNHFYLTNSEKISKEDFSKAIKAGKVFIDGWTASLNGTLQHYKEDVKIVF